MHAHQWKATLTPESIQAANLKDEIHVWVASLNQPNRSLALLDKTLSIDERQRAERFFFERDRRRFIAGRGILRVILGRYLDLPPRQIQFQYSANGKPYLSVKFHPCLIEFNLSHSSELALYALTCHRQIGIDIEALQPMPQAEEIAGQFFSENECTSILRLPKALRTKRFFELWTCKEAYIKALGEGLSHPLNQFEIAQISNNTKSIVDLTQSLEESRAWSITSFQPSAGYIAALAVDNHDWRIKFGQWSQADFQ